MNSEEVSTFWDWERRRYASQKSPTALLLKDIFLEFLDPKLQQTREDWNNLSDDRYYVNKTDPDHQWEDWRVGQMKNESQYNEFEKRAHLSFDDCGKACESLGTDECFGYRWSDDCCSMSNSFLLGKPVKKDDNEKKRTMSGWDIKKIRKWIDDQGPTCDKILWPDIS